MIVVQNQHNGGRHVNDFIEQLDHQIPGRWGLQRAQQGQRCPSDSRFDGPQGSDQIGNEAHEIVIVLIK